MHILQRLDAAFARNNSLLCIGLDPVLEKIPSCIRDKDPSVDAIFTFNKAIIDATHPYVMGYKPNSAFYEAHGAEGIIQLKKTCDYIKNNFPDLFLILDAKRGDIGSTNEGYVKYAFDYLGADAITVQPYLGKEALKPFFEREDKGIIVLCKTSNPESDEFQNVLVSSSDSHVMQEGTVFLYQHIARQVATEWNQNRNCLLVAGATYPEELQDVRSIVGDMSILLPGIGAQGGDLEVSLKAGLTKEKKGLIVSVSRSIIYASDTVDFADIAAEEAKQIYQTIQKICED